MAILLVTIFIIAIGGKYLASDDIQEQTQNISDSQGTNGTITYRGLGKIKYMNIGLNMKRNTVGVVNFSLPSNFVPSEIITEYVEDQSSPRVILKLTIRPNGSAVLLYNNTDTDNSSLTGYIHITYITN